MRTDVVCAGMQKEELFRECLCSDSRFHCQAVSVVQRFSAGRIRVCKRNAYVFYFIFFATKFVLRTLMY